MATPTIYIDTGGSATNSGSSDNNNADLTSVGAGTTASATGTTVTFSGATNLSAVPTDGSATIYLNDATNSNQKIFQITGVNDGADTVTVSVAPTGVSTSAWAIGGRHVLTNTSISGAWAAGWIGILNNSPASVAGVVLILRTAGSSGSGPITIKGKSGTRPVLTNTSTTQCISHNTNFNHWIENLEFAQQGASGAAASPDNGLCTFYNVKISDSGGNAMTGTVAGLRVIGCEITGAGADGINFNQPGVWIIGNYIHDLTGDGVELSSATPTALCLNNIIDTVSARGIFVSGSVSASATAVVTLIGNTIYGGLNSGIEITDADAPVTVMNNILLDNGNTSGEANIEWAAGAAEYVGFHAYNLASTAGGAGGDNLLGFTANATELTSDPLITNAASADFTLGSTSPAKATGYPGLFLGGPTGYLDMGAVQRQESGGGGTTILSPFEGPF